MKSKFQFEFDFKELSSLVRVLAAHQGEELTGKTDAIRRRYLKEYIKQTKKSATSVDGIRALTGDPIMDMIIEGISALTGIPVLSISHDSELEELGMTTFKKTQLRDFINDYIEANGGSTFISEDEIQNCKTVQDVYVLTITNLQ